MKVYNHPERGIVYNPNWPVEPKDVKCNFGIDACTCAEVAFESGANHDVVDEYDDNCPHRYNSALQTAIREAKEMEDQDKATAIIYNTLDFDEEKIVELKGLLKPATFYEVPDMKLELITSCGYYDLSATTCYNCAGSCYKPIQLYRIVSEPKQEPKVETQEELWKYVITESVSWNGHNNDLQLLIDQFQKEGYSITRKQS